MAIHPEVAAWGIAAGMVDMCRRAGQVAADARDQHVMDAWHAELAAARNNAVNVTRVAVEAVRRVADLTTENEELHAEVARLRVILRQRNAEIRALTN